jgi:hypothetical protein
MQQAFVSFDPTVFHSSLQCRKSVCGLGYFTDKEEQETIVKEALTSYRIMIFFKNYPQPSKEGGKQVTISSVGPDNDLPLGGGDAHD